MVRTYFKIKEHDHISETSLDHIKKWDHVSVNSTINNIKANAKLFFEYKVTNYGQF